MTQQQVLIVEDDPSTGLVLSDYVEMSLPDWKAQLIDNGYDAILQIGLVNFHSWALLAMTLLAIATGYGRTD